MPCCVDMSVQMADGIVIEDTAGLSIRVDDRENARPMFLPHTSLPLVFCPWCGTRARAETEPVPPIVTSLTRR